jgi:predicted nucleic acid-binding protein
VVSGTADSNIWISASSFRGKPRRLIEMADTGEIRLDISEAILEEVLRVLRDKFLWAPDALWEGKAQVNAIAHGRQSQITL